MSLIAVKHKLWCTLHELKLLQESASMLRVPEWWLADRNLEVLVTRSRSLLTLTAHQLAIVVDGLMHDDSLTGSPGAPQYHSEWTVSCSKCSPGHCSHKGHPGVVTKFGHQDPRSRIVHVGQVCSPAWKWILRVSARLNLCRSTPFP
jgi:hypothetical protein